MQEPILESIEARAVLFLQQGSSFSSASDPILSRCLQTLWWSSWHLQLSAAPVPLLDLSASVISRLLPSSDQAVFACELIHAGCRVRTLEVVRSVWAPHLSSWLHTLQAYSMESTASSLASLGDQVGTANSLSLSLFLLDSVRVWFFSVCVVSCMDLAIGFE